MPRIADQVLLEIINERACARLPSDVVVRAHRFGQLLLAARSLNDVAVFAKVERRGRGRFAIPVGGKWWITFSWSDAVGALSLKLQRLRKLE